MDKRRARGRVGGGGRVKQSVSTKVEGVVIRKSGKVMPEKPPMAGRVQKGKVIGVSAQKVTAVMTVSRFGEGSGPRRQVEGWRSGRTLAQAVQEAGSGVVAG